MRIGAFLPDETTAWRFQDAVCEGVRESVIHLDYHTSWEELIKGVEAGVVHMCVVDPGFSDSGPAPHFRFVELERLRRTLGGNGIILYPSRRDPPTVALRELGALGMPTLFLKDLDDHAGRILRSVARNLVRSLLFEWLDGDEVQLPRKVISHVLTVTAGWPPHEGVGSLIQGIPCSESTFRRGFTNSGLPSPRRFFRWGRALEAIALGELGVRQPGKAADLVGLSGSSSLERTLKELLGGTFNTVRTNGGLELALEGFREWMKCG